SKDGITLTIEVAEDLAVAMNAGHFQQVLMNLIVNARSAMLTAANGSHGGAGGIKRLTIRAARVRTAAPTRLGSDQSVEISVTDTGPGIPADVVPHIFEPFFSTKRRTAQTPAPAGEEGADAQAGEEAGRG